MILTLNIPPEKSAALQDQARRAGLPLEEYVQQFLGQAVTPSAPPAERLEETGDQKAERFLRWADSHARTQPVIPLETMDREYFYEERG